MGFLGAVLTAALLGIALSMDTFSVSTALGTRRKGRRALKLAFFLAVLFSFFHFAMPLLGYFAGSAARKLISNFDHWIAFLLLGFIGAKMIVEALGQKGKERGKIDFSAADYLISALATSVDAFAIGISLAFLGIPVFLSAAIISAANFLISFSGVYFGRFLGEKFKEKAEILGGLVLLGIGTKVLLEHLLSP